MELAASQRSNRKSRTQEPPWSQRRDTKTSESGKLPKTTVEPVPPPLRGRYETKQSTRRLFVRLPAKPPPSLFLESCPTFILYDPRRGPVRSQSSQPKPDTRAIDTHRPRQPGELWRGNGTLRRRGLSHPGT
ncbi:hypothetical protein LY76DRAFT_418373 [Colletotrichum caudatum]|nr:hypothetical protein LY76DRAFT_418373 [Colletotrichum caudatum]